ncbi:DUF4349 domain-containing protein [Amnibacterium sp.]|uniref:DUF4349 domain-containing protein n=1 Tax=Amnibacterium sp. TaxID=1872496 RepID=UPI0026280788|nr:DUF4349 domain-containing protein [Amnibacterium sp.]MCU1472934.1 hypothetical protein [Amnibacterium sp.]
MSTFPARRSRRAAVALLSALTVGALAGCTASGGSGGSAATTSRGGVSASASGAKSATTDSRAVVTTGTLDLIATDPVATADSVATVVAGSGGRIQARDEHPTRPASADLTVRIPSSVFDSTLTAIEHRAKSVRSVSIHASDVTSQVTDYAVRIANLRTSITRLQTLLARASDTAALVEIESSLTTRQTDLEELLAQQKDLTDQVSYATLAITLESPAIAHPGSPSTFISGLVAGVTALLRTAGAIAVLLGVLLPWVLTLGALAAVGWWVLRLVRRRARASAAPGA